MLALKGHYSTLSDAKTMPNAMPFHGYSRNKPADLRRRLAKHTAEQTPVITHRLETPEARQMSM
ncbi:MAG: hypothetical protein ACRCUY_13350 [Thermoguttaceae bacterium]